MQRNKENASWVSSLSLECVVRSDTVLFGPESNATDRFTILRCRIELCHELRFEATRRIIELSFSPHNLYQHCLQLPWAKYNEPEQ